MKKKVWNSATIPSSVQIGFWISLLPSSGKIVICADLSEKLQLSKGYKINFIQDEERPYDWYIEQTKDKSGLLFKIDLSNKKRNLYCAQRKALVLMMLDSLSLEKQSYRVVVSKEQQDKMYPIITKSAKPILR